MSGNFIYRYHVEPRVKVYSPREESFPFPLKYIDVAITTIGCYAWTSHRWLLEHRWIKRLVIICHKDICGPGLDRHNGKRRPGQIIYGWNRGLATEGEAEMVNWKPKLDNDWRLLGICFIDFEDKEFKETQEENWKHQWLPLCFAGHTRKASMARSVAILV